MSVIDINELTFHRLKNEARGKMFSGGFTKTEEGYEIEVDNDVWQLLNHIRKVNKLPDFDATINHILNDNQVRDGEW